MQIKPGTDPHYFSKPSPSFLLSFSHNVNPLTKTCLSFSLCHQTQSLIPNTPPKHCPAFLSFLGTLLRTTAKKPVAKGGLHGFPWQFFHLYKECKHTKTWPSLTTPFKCPLPFRFPADILLQIVLQLCKLSLLQLPRWWPCQQRPRCLSPL